jgi:hypothetical protein
MTTEQFRELRRLNENLEWLKNTQVIPAVNDLIPMKEAMQLLNRQRTWIQVRMVKDLEDGQDANMLLIRDVDWIREGNRVMFKRDSISRLKNVVLTAIGNKYDNI